MPEGPAQGEPQYFASRPRPAPLMSGVSHFEIGLGVGSVPTCQCVWCLENQQTAGPHSGEYADSWGWCVLAYSASESFVSWSIVDATTRLISL